MQTVKTYLNGNGLPIVRKCSNCSQWRKLDDTSGYCSLIKLQFAYTLQQTMYGITKKHNLCDNHVLNNEQLMQETGTPTTYDTEFLNRKLE